MPQILFIELKKRTMQKKNKIKNKYDGKTEDQNSVNLTLTAMEFILKNMSGNMTDETTFVNNQDRYTAIVC